MAIDIALLFHGRLARLSDLPISSLFGCMPVMGGSMSKFGFGRVTIAVISGFLVLPAVGVNVAGAAPVRAGAAAAPALSAADMASASALAATTGQPAEILADRTDFSQ